MIQSKARTSWSGLKAIGAPTSDQAVTRPSRWPDINSCLTEETTLVSLPRRLHIVTYVLPLRLVAVREYIDRAGRSPFHSWFDRLDARAAARVRTALARLETGNFSSVKGVGSGLFEFRIDFGPGYRIYFGKDGDQLVILVGGGTKARQQQDIERALMYWQEYKRRKQEAGSGSHT